MTRFNLVLCTVALLIAGCPVSTATTYYFVGNCHPGSYKTIGDAIANAAAGSSIQICPGTYPEQLFITKPMTLHGMTNNNVSDTVIAIPAGGLATESSLYITTGLAPQIEILADGVTISNLTVDGTAGSSNCPDASDYAGIMFAAGSSGTINQVAVLNQACNGGGIGILAENGAGTERTVTIQGGSVRNSQYISVVGYSNQPTSTLTLNFQNNNVVTGSFWAILMAGSVGGTISHNTVTQANYSIYWNSTATGTISNNLIYYDIYGIEVARGQPTVTGNTIAGALGVGIEASGGKITSNYIVNTMDTGMNILSNTVTVQANHIANAPREGISFNCNSPVLSGNFITDTPIGIDKVPASYSGTNMFSNVATERSGGC